MRSIVIPVLAAALAASCPAFAQNTSSGNASEQGNSSSSAGKNAVLSINKLKQDLQRPALAMFVLSRIHLWCRPRIRKATPPL